ncbi:MAG: crotonase/enoyl-CoA hydratase family protein [Gammaproteobacteria bacterium]|nr:crotonase/enoyl-CoA hydratase family protein [Gammaproteobacteria bacterium]
MADEILTEVRGKTLLICLNRPDAMNAINQDLADQLAAASDQLDNDPNLSVGVLCGIGRGFSAGMDLKAFVAEGMPEVSGRGFGGITEQGPTKPLIAAIEGFALAGGLELAMSCDILVASKGTKLGIPETGVGLFAAGGALLRLPRALPYGLAMKMALTAKPITAEVAHQYGLVTELTENGEAVNVALELADQISKNAPLGLQASKALLREMQGRTEEQFWAFQKKEHMPVFDSADATEGATAFAEKRAPNWQGK